MGKTLRSSSMAANNATGVNKLVSQLEARVSLLEKRYSRVMIHQTYFKVLDEWIQCMFGVELFPKPKDMGKCDEETMDQDIDNPFYEVHLLHQRVNFIEEELEGMGIDIPQLKPQKKASATTPVSAKGTPTGKRSYGGRRAANANLKPPVLKVATVGKKKEGEDDESKENSNSAPGVDEKGEDGDEKPPILKEIKEEVEEDEKKENDKTDEGPEVAVSHTSEEKMELEDDDPDDEDYEQKPDLDDLDYAVAKYTERRIVRESAKRKMAYADDDDDEEESAATAANSPVTVTYTTRGRRHTLPRRYAEFTGHDNVASILKSQQKGGGVSGGPKAKKAALAGDKPAKSPGKARALPKLLTPKKVLDGSRPECVYKLIADVQSKEVDEDGNVVLFEEIPGVKVNQQQLISVIFRSNGMATRLTRKLTTLVFEDQVLANTSPFGTKYYSERLPPEPLEAMVEFISHSGFDADYTKKKIYMVVGQVCNEARAGRVRKLLPTAGSSGTSASPAPAAAGSAPEESVANNIAAPATPTATGPEVVTSEETGNVS